MRVPGNALMAGAYSRGSVTQVGKPHPFISWRIMGAECMRSTSAMENRTDYVIFFLIEQLSESYSVGHRRKSLDFFGGCEKICDSSEESAAYIRPKSSPDKICSIQNR